MGQCFVECGKIMEVKLPRVCALCLAADEMRGGWLVGERLYIVGISLFRLSPRFSRVLYLASFCRVLRAA